jgi:gluconate kinase
MAVKLFVLGRPGSGKSAAFRHLKQYIKDKYGWTTVHYNDYDILQDMFRFENLFRFENKPRQFRATKHDGFDVLDFSVLDTALKKLEKNVRSRYSKNEKDELIVIEFARNDHSKALRLFSPEFLKDAYFLFLDTGLEKCINRVQERVDHPTCEDDHFVSENILRSYYSKEILPFNSVIDKRNMKVIHNNRSYPAFVKKLERFVENILANELVIVDYKNVQMDEAIMGSSVSIEQIDHNMVQRSVFHLPSISARAFVSFLSSSHQKVK